MIKFNKENNFIDVGVWNEEDYPIISDDYEGE